MFNATFTNSSARVWFGALGHGQGLDDLGNTVTDGDGAVRLKVAGFQIVQVATAQPPVLAARLSGGSVVLNWPGTGFKLQSSGTLVSPSWVDYALPAGTNPPVSVPITTGRTTSFFRLAPQ